MSVRPFIIRPIVEGHGEIEAFPVLLRRLQQLSSAWNIVIEKPVRLSKGKIVAKDDDHVRRILRRTRNEGCDAILVLFDSDGDCPLAFASWIEQIAATEIADIWTKVVVAHQEYEAWFLAGIETLRGQRGIQAKASPSVNPEGIRGAKEWLEEQMDHGSSYSETADQPAFSERFSLVNAYSRSRSFRKLVKTFGDLMEALGDPLDNWPPPSLTGGG